MTTAIMIRRLVFLAMFGALVGATGHFALAQSEISRTSGSLHVGVAEVDITPPVGFPMAGYYHERLAEGQIDRLKAKAIVFRGGEPAWHASHGRIRAEAVLDAVAEG